jgi:uncharacterized protein YheU (UPF0270 family)
MTDESKLLGLEMGFLTGINILIESLVSEEKIDAGSLASRLKQKIEEFREQLHPISSDAANILDQMRRPLISEERARMRKFLNDPPQGAA